MVNKYAETRCSGQLNCNVDCVTGRVQNTDTSSATYR